jgi:hypothetical protein
MSREVMLATLFAASMLTLPVLAAKKPTPQRDWKTGILLATPDPGYSGPLPQNTFLIRDGDILFHVQLSNGWSLRKPDVTERGPVKYTMEDGVFYLLDEDGREYKVSVKKKELRPQDSDSVVSAGVYRIGGSVTQPTVIYKVEPEYSEEARKAKFQGTVVLFLVVDEDGLEHLPD